KVPLNGTVSEARADGATKESAVAVAAKRSERKPLLVRVEVMSFSCFSWVMNGTRIARHPNDSTLPDSRHAADPSNVTALLSRATERKAHPRRPLMRRNNPTSRNAAAVGRSDWFAGARPQTGTRPLRYRAECQRLVPSSKPEPQQRMPNSDQMGRPAPWHCTSLGSKTPQKEYCHSRASSLALVAARSRCRTSSNTAWPADHRAGVPALVDAPGGCILASEIQTC